MCVWAGIRAHTWAQGRAPEYQLSSCLLQRAATVREGTLEPADVGAAGGSAAPPTDLHPSTAHHPLRWYASVAAWMTVQAATSPSLLHGHHRVPARGGREPPLPAWSDAGGGGLLPPPPARPPL